MTSVMRGTLQNAKFLASADVCNLSEDYSLGVLQNANMAKEADEPEPNHLKAWREFRHLTQDELGAAVGTNGSQISLLENGGRKLSPKWLRRLAPHLNTSPGYLLDHDPNDLPTAILDIWAEIPSESRDQALKVLQSFKRTGTDG